MEHRDNARASVFSYNACRLILEPSIGVVTAAAVTAAAV